MQRRHGCCRRVCSFFEQCRREVDAILEDARERALNIRAEAEQRARQITAEAEQHRAELEEQVAALRAVPRLIPEPSVAAERLASQRLEQEVGPSLNDLRAAVEALKRTQRVEPGVNESETSAADRALDEEI